MEAFASEQRDLVERLLPQVRTVMEVRSTVRPAERTGAHAQFNGKLRTPSDQAYQRLEPAFAREGVTLLLREQDGEHVILAADKLPEPGPSRPWVNLLLFILTLGSVLYSGVLNAAGYLGLGPNLDSALLRQALPLGGLYAVSLLGILLAHEFGHYLMGRYHKTAVSLPYFLPFPGALFGTLGAFIQLKSPAKSRRALLDIGLAGPLAGLAIALPATLIGLALSDVSALPTSASAAAGSFQEGNSILYVALKFIVTGKLLPEPLSYGGLPPLLYWLRYIATGSPAPFGGLDVQLHPMALAGWAGLLVTGLNLIPVGQLDGGHSVYTLFGRAARRLWLPFVVGLAAFGVLVWSGWLLWAGLIYFFGRLHAVPLDDVTPLDPGRRALAIFALVLFVIVVTPIPIQPLAGP